MKYNMKNPIWHILPAKAKKLFEKELKEFAAIPYPNSKMSSKGWRGLIKEILGE